MLSRQAWPPSIGILSYASRRVECWYTAAGVLTLFLGSSEALNCRNLACLRGYNMCFPLIISLVFGTIEQGPVGRVSLLPPVRVTQSAAAPRFHGQVGVRRKRPPNSLPTPACCRCSARFVSSLALHSLTHSLMNRTEPNRFLRRCHPPGISVRP